MKLILISIVLFVSSCSLVTNNESALPTNLAGVWLSSDAKLTEHILVSGVAVYLMEDGSGAIFAAPPMLGRRIMASYDIESQIISYNELDSSGKIVRQGTLKYVPNDNALIFQSEKNIALNKQTDVIPSKTKRLLGL